MIAHDLSGLPRWADIILAITYGAAGLFVLCLVAIAILVDHDGHYRWRRKP